MPGSRLLPTEQRTALPAAPTTSRWWRTHVLVRSWLNRHRHRWLAPLLLCAPPVGVAMVWAGATRPGHHRRWLTAGAAVWTLAIVLAVVLVTVPGASHADADSAPPVLAGGPALAAPTTGATPTRDAAAAAAAARGASAGAAGVAAAAVDPGATTAGSGSDTGGADSDGSGAGNGATTGGGASSDPAPAAAPAAPAAPAPTTAAPNPPRATSTQTPRPTPPRPTQKPPKPSIPTANPFTSCSVEGAQALSPNGFSLRCFRTPIGLFWLWG